MTRHFCTSLPFCSLPALLMKAYCIFLDIFSQKLTFFFLKIFIFFKFLFCLQHFLLQFCIQINQGYQFLGILVGALPLGLQLKKYMLFK